MAGKANNGITDWRSLKTEANRFTHSTLQFNSISYRLRVSSKRHRRRQCILDDIKWNCREGNGRLVGCGGKRIEEARNNACNHAQSCGVYKESHEKTFLSCMTKTE